jgi:hypothetical protein
MLIVLLSQDRWHAGRRNDITRPIYWNYLDEVNSAYTEVIGCKLSIDPFRRELKWVSSCLSPNEKCYSYIMTRASYMRWDDNNVRFLLDHHA